jgi:hypothetical protein
MLRIEVDEKNGPTNELCPGAKRHPMPVNEALGIHANHLSYSPSKPQRHLSLSKDCVVILELQLFIARDGALSFRDFGWPCNQPMVLHICQSDLLGAAVCRAFVTTSGKENKTLLLLLCCTSLSCLYQHSVRETCIRLMLTLQRSTGRF